MSNPPSVLWRRKLEVDGAWYAQARDGSWSRWDHAASDWVGVREGPPGGASPLEPEGSVDPYPPPRGSSGSGHVAWDFFTTFLGVTTPAFFALLIGITAMAMLTFIWNVFFAMWWGEPIEPQTVLWPTLAGVLTFSFFLSGGITIARVGGRGAIWLAAAVVAAGTGLTLLLVSRMTGLGPMQVLTSRTTAFAFVMIALSWAGVSLRRWLAEN